MSSQWTSFETSSIVHQQTNSEAQSTAKAGQKASKPVGKKKKNHHKPHNRKLKTKKIKQTNRARCSSTNRNMK